MPIPIPYTIRQKTLKPITTQSGHVHQGILSVALLKLGTVLIPHLVDSVKVPETGERLQKQKDIYEQEKKRLEELSGVKAKREEAKTQLLRTDETASAESEKQTSADAKPPVKVDKVAEAKKKAQTLSEAVFYKAEELAEPLLKKYKATQEQEPEKPRESEENKGDVQASIVADESSEEDESEVVEPVFDAYAGAPKTMTYRQARLAAEEFQNDLQTLASICRNFAASSLALITTLSGQDNKESIHLLRSRAQRAEGQTSPDMQALGAAMMTFGTGLVGIGIFLASTGLLVGLLVSVVGLGFFVGGAIVGRHLPVKHYDKDDLSLADAELGDGCEMVEVASEETAAEEADAKRKAAKEAIKPRAADSVWVEPKPDRRGFVQV